MNCERNVTLLHDVAFADSSTAYEAATTAAALIDLTDRAQIELSGKDRQSFLHNFCTNDIKKLQPGEGCEAFLSSIKGRILGHLLVLCEAERLLLDSVPGSDEFIIPHLDKYLITEEVTISNRSSELADLLITGPQAAELLQASFGVIAADLKMYSHQTVRHDAEDVLVLRVPFTVAPSFLVMAPVGVVAKVWQALRDAGATAAAGEVFGALRIEAGFPLFGIDLSDDLIAQEAGRTQQAISFAKGCYLGQEPIARLDSLGHANRMLRRLRLDAAPAPATGAAVLDESSREPIGTVSSAAVSAADGRPVALALLKTRLASPGARVIVKADETVEVAATVVGE
jgi:tRNA-modifying protein YgfZ